MHVLEDKKERPPEEVVNQKEGDGNDLKLIS
jgi:hypothetical protein